MALTATAFTYVTLPTDAQPSRGPDPRRHGRIENKSRIVRIRAQLDNASSGAAYPTSGGIPLSTTAGDFGMIRNLDYVVMYGQGHTGTGLATAVPVWKYAPTSHSILGFRGEATNVATAAGLRELSTTWTPTLSPFTTVFYFEAHGW